MVSSCRSFLTSTDQNHKHSCDMFTMSTSSASLFTPTNMHARYFNACLMILSKRGLDFKVLRKYLFWTYTCNGYYQIRILKNSFCHFRHLHTQVYLCKKKKKTFEKDVLFKCYICLIICYWVHAMCCYKLSYVVFKGYIVLQIG